MSNQPRVAKVLAALLVSMTMGAIVLMALGNHPPSAGPFCLSSYYRLDPVEKAVLSRTAQLSNRWNSIEVYYSSTEGGNIEQLAAFNGLHSQEDINCHFVVCNGIGGEDGQIQPTEKWQKQWSIVPRGTWYGSSQTIRICTIGTGKIGHTTDLQKRRIDALVEVLHRKFNITSESISYPNNW